MIPFSKKEFNEIKPKSNVFNMTIYSQKNKKRYLSMIKKYKNKRKNPTNNLDIYYKYLKSLECEFQSVNLTISNKDLESKMDLIPGLIYINKTCSFFEKF